MTTQEQKDLCIRLYKEGNHTIKEILNKTGLRFAPYIYAILDKAGIPRNHKKSNQVSPEKKTINLEESRTKFLSLMCRLYHGEEDNPFTSEEYFKRYMWRNEKKILDNSQLPDMIEMYRLEDPKNWGNFFRSQIKAYISLWDKENAGKWLGTYMNYSKKGC